MKGPFFRPFALALALLALPAIADPPSDAPVASVLAPNPVEIRVGDAVPFDGVLTEAGEYHAQAQGVAAIISDRDIYKKRPSLLAVIIIGASCFAAGAIAAGVVFAVAGDGKGAGK